MIKSKIFILLILSNSISYAVFFKKNTETAIKETVYQQLQKRITNLIIGYRSLNEAMSSNKLNFLLTTGIKDKIQNISKDIFQALTDEKINLEEATDLENQLEPAFLLRIEFNENIASIISDFKNELEELRAKKDPTAIYSLIREVLEFIRNNEKKSDAPEKWMLAKAFLDGLKDLLATANFNNLDHRGGGSLGYKKPEKLSPAERFRSKNIRFSF